MAMQHDDAIRTHAAERYMLGEMSADERAHYEEHYFACAACETELAATAAFVDNARLVLATPSTQPEALRPGPTERPRDPWWQRFFAAPPLGLMPALTAASLVLVAIVGYQQFAVIPQLRQQLASRDTAQGVPTLALRSTARGSGSRLLVTSADTYAVLQADVLPETRVARYTASLLAADGQERFRTSLSAPEPGIPATILVPVRELAPGDYTLVFADGEQDGREIGRFIFTLEKQ